ncbi:MAG: hypothetical protein AB1558_09015 [Thermodesulfobacteriota bacterium]
MREKGKNYPLIPEDERKCIWMTTGFIQYKLCDRNHQCEICPFEQALKNEENGEGDFLQPEEDWKEGSPDSDPSIRIHGAVFYHPDHCWVKVENPERVRVGIDDLLTQLLTDVKVVTLPRKGSLASAGECVAHIIQADYILPVISPLSGSVQAVNHRLIQEPQLITDDPRGEGWLITIRPNNLESELKDLLFGREAVSWYRRAEKEIIARTEQMVRHNLESVGPTMQDGGVKVGCLQELLRIVNSKQRAQIIDSSINRSRHLKRS